ncbi:MAG: hypothetical protein GXO91_06495 [FCB group bacterium]|nr:hypothetical protein [FCB group bacterium]
MYAFRQEKKGADGLKRLLSVTVNSPEFSLVLYTFFYHFAWEILQAPLFENMGTIDHWKGTQICLRATIGDVLMTIFIFGAMGLLYRSRFWYLELTAGKYLLYIALGEGMTLVFEWLATARWDRWQYDQSMPVLPLLGTGLLPLLQWLIIPSVVLWQLRKQGRVA